MEVSYLIGIAKGELNTEYQLKEERVGDGEAKTISSLPLQY